MNIAFRVLSWDKLAVLHWKNAIQNIVKMVFENNSTCSETPLKSIAWIQIRNTAFLFCRGRCLSCQMTYDRCQTKHVVSNLFTVRLHSITFQINFYITHILNEVWSKNARFWYSNAIFMLRSNKKVAMEGIPPKCLSFIYPFNWKLTFRLCVETTLQIESLRNRKKDK